MKKESTKEIASKIQDLLTVCLAKAFDLALSTSDSPYWFYYFVQEELMPDQKFPIARAGQQTVYDLDFQALMKILFYRRRYALKILSFFGREELISKDPKKKTPFERTLGRLINDYRNQIAAHVSADKIQDNIKGINSKAGYDYGNAILDMTSVAQVFKAITDEKGVSYYKQIKDLSKGTRPVWPWIVTGAAAFILILAAVIIIPLAAKPDTPEPETNILDIKDNDIGDDNSNEIAREFFFKAKDIAARGLFEEFSSMFEPGYTEEEIRYIYDRLREGDYKKEMDTISSFVYTDNEILAYQWISDDQPASRWFLKRVNGEWKFGANVSDNLLKLRYDKLSEKLREYFNIAPHAIWISEDYENLFEVPMSEGVYIKVYAVTENIVACFLFNGTDKTVRSIKLTNTVINYSSINDTSSEALYIDKSSDKYAMNCEIAPNGIAPVIITIDPEDKVPDVDLSDPENSIFKIKTDLEWSENADGIE